MQLFARKLFGEIGWGVPSSIVLHLVLALLLLVRLPELPSAPEQSVDVELVPPPPAEEKAEEEPKETPPPPSQAAPQAFESASADVKEETPPQPDLPPAAPETTPNPDETPPAAAAETKNEATADNAQDAAAPAIENPPVPQDKPAPEKPVATAVADQRPEKFTQARRLYSRDALSDPRVKQAIGKLSPTDRVIQICSIEALEQIRHHQPGAFPDMLARAGGSVSNSGLTVSNGAFRSRAQWYAVDFKCQIDPEAMTIQSFSYAIGHAIPESEWGPRQLPRD